MSTSKVVLWDFDGTLAERLDDWRGAVMEVLDKHEPGHDIRVEQIRPYLRQGFFWHKPEEPHPHVKTSEEWWSQTETIFVRAYESVGLDRPRAKELARLVRGIYLNPDRFTLYDDTISALTQLGQNGWRHGILSNHVPELPEIVRALGLSKYVGFTITSAASGYEKPNHEAFRNAVKVAGNPDVVWMVGDNPIADVRGAESAGVPAILVHNPNEGDCKYHAPSLLEAALIIDSVTC